MKFIRTFFKKLFKVNDTPQRVAAGFGIGVFSGILPGTGPLAALFLATLFRVNRASALLGGLLTNTWLSLVIFAFSVTVGARITGFDYETVRINWVVFFRDFHFVKLFSLAALKIIFPVIVGYCVVAACCGIVSYILVLMVLTITQYFRTLHRR
ncbi:MAG: DUF2062 domain-containing protein [Candidatus Omnitrophota bacterium]|nr:DUF2062 domain-containing protein [Candidatus Omnitrophota bacterium]